MIPMAKDWAKYNNSNVCLVDWSFLAKGSYIFVVDFQLERVAKEMIKFTEILRPYGLNYTQVSVAGHSLGAHVAGLFGRAVQSKGWKIYAIYGMRIVLHKSKLKLNMYAQSGFRLRSSRTSILT